MTSTSPDTTAPHRRRQRVRYLDGDKLLRWRLDVDLTQEEVAAKAGGKVTQSLVSAWERGRQGTSMPNVRLLAKALGKEPEDLMPDELLDRLAAGRTPRVLGKAS
jgi:transcriptional regulator with XRE-family HTH domain